MQNFTRRRFFEDSLMAAAAVALPAPIFAAETKSVSSNSKLTAAIIGCGIRGKAHARELAKLADCDVAYVCDPDLDRADEVGALLVELKRPMPKKVQDLRAVYADKSVDVVFIATPNHWHALAAIWAMQAGKDVYVEKPVSHNVAEGRRIVQVARKLGRICQTGTQNRSRAPLAEAVKYMREGKLGEVKLARSIMYGGRGSIGGPVECPTPPRCDYNLWAGPAPMTKLTRSKFHYDWHWMWDTGNGDLGNSNVHALDVCRWGLGVTGLGRGVLSYGGRLGYTDVGETPNTQVGIFDFGDKTIVSETRGLKTVPFHPTIKSMWFFYGTEGIIAETSLYDPKGQLIRAFEGQSENHFANFLRAVRSRQHTDLAADILEGHQSSALCHIANISYRLGQTASPADIAKHLGDIKVHEDVQETFERTRQSMNDAGVDLEKTRFTLGQHLRVDGDKEKFIDNAQADALLARQYRAPFVVLGENEV
ncbi:MAG: Gfo/Idh/MocA family protein [Prosthecobacter sp.]|uniref:Gfo/Idh/MocA family protein n=1 Tax=Prosthecobacter sp. TaxID=1965333 RepID=UPI003900A556